MGYAVYIRSGEMQETPTRILQSSQLPSSRSPSPTSPLTHSHFHPTNQTTSNMRFSATLVSVVALCFAALVSSSPIPVAEPQPEAAQPVVAREPACRLINACI
ncbi:hypothetical protein D9611_006649 [Ephemerocybe angulata]|uniref:Uncharacterized protein n=2 Tax=Ephemerocybe angulata TaxID=980116 RepID=A0A8H5C7E3_9AGAR|nr:hypothetical protein D9611_006649 [Tulosesus angulatus]